jgi:hypothetical protein
MGMQYDVKSAHLSASGQVVGSEVRLKSVTVTSGTVSARETAFVDPTTAIAGTWDRPAGTPGPITVTITVDPATIPAPGLATGDRVAIDFSGSAMRDGVYVITVTGDTTITVQSVTTGAASGTCSLYTANNILLELDTYNTVGLPILIPGEGIRCNNGIYAILGASVTATVYYG